MRGVIVLLLLALVVCTCSCGAVFVGGFTRFNNQTSISGTVSVVHLIVTDGGVQVTFVTLVQPFGPQDFQFCGNVVPQFPLNTAVTVNFTPGTVCGSNLAVVVVL
jgi:hypothetical protein